jgi:XTP/dITP diphosphohydrolase
MAEIRRILADVPDLEILDLDDAEVRYDPAEDALEPHETFDGRPGVRTKRFAPGDGLEGEARDRANNAYLLHLLGGMPPPERGARYVCVAALVSGTGETLTFRGEAPGKVLTEPRGGGGFGYDPIILDESSGRSFAELSPEEKNERSHRGRAFRALGVFLKERG